MTAPTEPFVFDDPALAPQSRPPADLLAARLDEHEMPAPPATLDDDVPAVEAVVPRSDVDEVSPLSQLLAGLRQQLAPPDRVYPVAQRDGTAVRFRVTIRDEEMRTWRQQAADPTAPEGVAELKLGCLILSSCCTGILVDGVEVRDGHGPVTLRSPLIRKSLAEAKAAREAEDAGKPALTPAELEAVEPLGPREAVREFYVLDGQVNATMSMLLIAAGWGWAPAAVTSPDRNLPQPGQAPPDPS